MNYWEVRDDFREDSELFFRVQRGTEREGNLEEAASGISDYGLACLIEAACNMRDGTVE